MIELIKEYLPWLLSAITITLTELIGRKWRNAWLFGLCGQALWLLWIACMQAWGLLPLTLTLIVQYTRNHLRWRREANPPRAASSAIDRPEWKMESPNA